MTGRPNEKTKSINNLPLLCTKTQKLLIGNYKMNDKKRRSFFANNESEKTTEKNNQKNSIRIKRT